MFGLGPREIIILAIVFLLLFGAKKIPEFTRSIGEAIRHVRSGFSDDVPDDIPDDTKDNTNKKS